MYGITTLPLTNDIFQEFHEAIGKLPELEPLVFPLADRLVPVHVGKMKLVFFVQNYTLAS